MMSLVIWMKRYLKKIIISFLIFNILCLCGCKNAQGDISSAVDNASEITQTETENIVSDKTESGLNAESEITQSELENTVSDQTLDPENNDVGRDNGEKVQFAKPQTGGKVLAHGIDVSKWQGKIDWKSVKKAGIDFAIIRIGYRGENGKIYRDDNADYNIQQAQSAGILVGVYFFSTAINTDEARREAAWTAKAIKGYKISYPVVYDCEGYNNPSSRMYGISAESRTDNALEFLKYIKSKGYDAMIYGAKADFEDAYLWDISRIEKDYKVWLAHYSQEVYPAKQNPDYGGRCDMWQYTNRGTVDGVEGNCDMVVSYFKSKEAAAKDKTDTPAEAKPPKTEEELIFTDTNDKVTAKDEVNLREGPSTKHNKVGTLKSGEFVTRTGIGKNGWSRLLYNGKTVYAISSYLSNKVIEVENPDVVNGMTFTACKDKVTAKMEVNLRELPSTDSKVAGKLKSGEFLPRTATSDKGWSRLKYNGAVVYAITSYLTTEAPEIQSSEQTSSDKTVTEHDMTFELTKVNVTAKEEVNLRNKPTTTDSKIVHTLKNGEYITKTGVSNSGWARLDYNGKTVYCIDSFLMQ